MSKTSSFLIRFLGALLLVALLIGGGVMLFSAGQTRGYMLGANTAGSPSTAVEPGAALSNPYWYPHMGYHFGFFPFMHFGGLFAFLGMALLFCFLLRLVFFPFRGRFFNGDYPRGHWHGHPYWHGPWDEEPKSEKPDKPAEETKA